VTVRNWYASPRPICSVGSGVAREAECRGGLCGCRRRKAGHARRVAEGGGGGDADDATGSMACARGLIPGDAGEAERTRSHTVHPCTRHRSPEFHHRRRAKKERPGQGPCAPLMDRYAARIFFNLRIIGLSACDEEREGRRPRHPRQLARLRSYTYSSVPIIVHILFSPGPDRLKRWPVLYPS
jgi:hypothetical protein